MEAAAAAAAAGTDLRNAIVVIAEEVNLETAATEDLPHSSSVFVTVSFSCHQEIHIPSKVPG